MDFPQDTGWCVVQLKKSQRLGIGLFGTMNIGGVPAKRFLVWMPHLGPIEHVGERHIEDHGFKNYLIVKPENVSSAIKLSADIFDSEVEKIWKGN